VSSRVDAPYPPPELMARIGRLLRGHDEEWLRDTYERSGAARKRAILETLPAGYSFEGRRVLDFGCGAGRVLRQFLPEAESGEFWGCDLHAPTISWLSENLSPPMRFYVNDEMPLPHPDGHFDLVYALSVFTHITYDWSSWLLELHRVLKPDGLFLATFMGPATWEPVTKRRIEEDKLGMAALGLHRVIEETSGPMVLHSPWWIRSHWGRAFDVVVLRPEGFVKRGQGHGVFLGRRRSASLTPDDLERIDEADPRELDAQREQRRLLDEEAARLLDPAKLRRFERARAAQDPASPRSSAWRRLIHRARWAYLRARHGHDS
jgi:SAM-dependent methyltransferase